MDIIKKDYYAIPERRQAQQPRRVQHYHRRHRLRLESLVSDCRVIFSRRKEDEEGFVEITNFNEYH